MLALFRSIVLTDSVSEPKFCKCERLHLLGSILRHPYLVDGIGTSKGDFEYFVYHLGHIVVQQGSKKHQADAFRHSVLGGTSPSMEFGSWTPLFDTIASQ